MFICVQVTDLSLLSAIVLSSRDLSFVSSNLRETYKKYFSEYNVWPFQNEAKYIICIQCLAPASPHTPQNCISEFTMDGENT